MSDLTYPSRRLRHDLACQVLELLMERLARAGSALAAGEPARASLTALVGQTLDWTLSSLIETGPRRTKAWSGDSVTVAAGDTKGVSGGREWARQNSFPAYTQEVAEFLLEACLVTLLEMMPGMWDAAALAADLHEATHEIHGFASYTDTNNSLERLSGVHAEDRLATAQDLHDRVANGIVAAQIQLHLSGSAGGGGAGSHHLDLAVKYLHGALMETQSISAELRCVVGSKQLHEAVVDFAHVADPSQTPVFVSVRGDSQRLKNGIQEEAFMVIRQLVSNARRHTGASAIHVDFTWAPTWLLVAVSDDGRGSNRADLSPGALELINARERAEVIGAELETIATTGTGTVLTLSIPIAEVGR